MCICNICTIINMRIITHTHTFYPTFLVSSSHFSGKLLMVQRKVTHFHCPTVWFYGGICIPVYVWNNQFRIFLLAKKKSYLKTQNATLNQGKTLAFIYPYHWLHISRYNISGLFEFMESRERREANIRRKEVIQAMWIQVICR